MTNEQFCYWLQGFAELNKEPPTNEQWDDIRAHLNSVFVNVTTAPSISASIMPTIAQPIPAYC